MTSDSKLENWIMSSAGDLDKILVNRGLSSQERKDIIDKLEGVLNIFIDVTVTPEFSKRGDDTCINGTVPVYS